MSSKTPEQHLQNISEGWDKTNAHDFLAGKVTMEVGKTSTHITVNGNTLDLGKIKPEDSDLVESIIKTLIVEKSVCEARLYLAAQCKAEVAVPGIQPLGQKGDIEFNKSAWTLNTSIVKYETLHKIFNTNAVRPIGAKIIEFINKLPENYIPRLIIETPTQDSTSYTARKEQDRKKVGNGVATAKK